ncbi:extensin family protein [Nioella sp.]|uniref:extensin-like domain-containing protein n=1 Tax=Nioella sp. TaxID=1912091 RepID=UPI003B527A0F
MRLARAALVAVLGFALPAQAYAPAQSLRPLPRPVSTPAPQGPADRVVGPSDPLVVTIRATDLAPSASLRPIYRPGRAEQVTEIRPDQTIVAELPPEETEERGPPRGLLALLTGQNRLNPPGVTAVRVSLRPVERPAGLAAAIRAAETRGTPGRVTQPGQRGALCGQRGIIGDRLERIPGRINGCGIAEPVRVREIDGITLAQPATINCDTALAVQEWLNDAVIPTVGRHGGGVASLRVVASYSCRTRNNQPGARLSEHATGNAIDIAGIGLVDGSEISVLDDWDGGREGRILRQLHEAACGTFGTVLGPGADRYHRDHFHFDVAAYRNGAYCR